MNLLMNFFLTKFFDKFFDEFYYILTIASFRIGVPSILFLSEDGFFLNLVLHGVLTTTLALFGIICNSLSIAIFLKSGKKSLFNSTLIGKQMVYRFQLLFVFFRQVSCFHQSVKYELQITYQIIVYDIKSMFVCFSRSCHFDRALNDKFSVEF